MRLNSLAIVAALALSALPAIDACGSSGSSGSMGAGACQSACARCGGDPCADCAGTSDRYRDEYKSALFSCVSDADACSAATWSTCSTQAFSSAPRRSGDDAYRDACMTKRNACAAQGVNFADDNCLLSSFLADAWLQKANDCLAKGCTDIAGCLREIFN